ncbi:hypothetical protein BB934_45610 (plasmid) [Microvirga ossetica]|uniref:NarX-like N-terminal domain-containing protein n=1 Tax=Microvirga ossetica TaxID=1882682 RepID=A0A1B2EZS7_9HYPH|nr:hypothetical protein [Microvirga ossetica]ANY85500.1 hypothetical protein BB934_45610 [Microvirga ossetica]
MSSNSLKVVAITAGLLFGSFAVHAQQGSPDNSAPSSNALPADKCAEFNSLLSSIDSTGAAGNPDQVEKRYGRLVDAAKIGEACAKSITESFRNLRGQAGSPPSWAKIEQELDKLIEAQRNFIDKIEGTGGLIEEANRSGSVIQKRIEEAQRVYPDQVDREKERLARLTEIAAATTVQKDGLAKAIRDIQAAKPRIAFAESGKQFDVTVNALDRFNKALEDFTKKMPKPVPGESGT